MVANMGKRLKALEVKAAPPKLWTIVRTFWEPTPDGPRCTGAQTRLPGGGWIDGDHSDRDGVTVNIHKPAEA